MKSLFIATPMYGGMCCGAYTSSLVDTISALGANGYQVSYSIMVNESLINRARNNLTMLFLESNCSHLFFIDSDISFDKNDVLKMLEYDVPILAGIYPKKLMFLDRIVDSTKDGKSKINAINDCFEWVGAVGKGVDSTLLLRDPTASLKQFVYAGAGFMMISRGVFEKLMPVVERYKNNFQDIERETYNFFGISIDPVSKILLSEDYHFCKTCGENNIPIYVAPWISLNHTGTYTFGLSGEV